MIVLWPGLHEKEIGVLVVSSSEHVSSAVCSVVSGVGFFFDSKKSCMRSFDMCRIKLYGNEGYSIHYEETGSFLFSVQSF